MDQGITVKRASISSRAAQRAVAAAVEQGRRLGCRMNAAVVDAGGNLLAFLRDDGAFLHSIHIAQDKAYTAAGFGMSTSALHDAVKDPPVLREGIARRDRLVLFGGGFPVRVADEVVGGIGCSGGSEEQDALCARAGLEAIGVEPS